MANNELRVTLLGDASKLNATLKTASGRLKSFGKSTQAVGRSLQTRLALPLAIAGGAAIKMAGDFDKSMTKIKSLVGIASDEVDEMGVGVKAMAKEFAISSADAADALFFVTSAGLRGKDAMEALEGAMKASAIGMGEAKTIAQLTSAAMNAYGSDTLNASDATDVLTAAIREGSIESDELASVMGQVLPVASNMGIAFDQVGAAFAAMSRTGTPAAQAATQLNSIMMGIMKPTQQAADAMELMGLSSAGLRQQIKDEGLLSVLNTLKEGANQNATAFETAFGNVRALRGVLDLTGKSMETTREIFGRMTNTQGMVQTAFDATAQSAEFRLRKAMNSARESFAQLGSMLLTGLMPIFEDVSRVIQNVFNAFFNLDEGTQKLIIGLGAFAVVLPTIITLVGTLTTLFGALLSPVALVAGAIAGIAYIIYNNMGESLSVIVGLYNQFVDLFNGSEILRKAIFGLKAVFASVFIAAKAQVDQLVNSFSTMWKLIKEFAKKGFKGSFGDILKDGFDNSIEITKKAGEDIGNEFTDSLDRAVGATLEKKTYNQVKGALDNVVSKTKGLANTLAQSLIGDVGGGGGTAPSGGDGSGETTLQPSHGFIGGFGLPDPKVEEEKVGGIIGLLTGLGVKMEEMEEVAMRMGEAVSGAFSTMGTNMVNSLGLAENGFQGFVKNMAMMVIDLISMLLANAIATAISNAVVAAGGTGFAAPFTMPMYIATMVGGVTSAFAAIPKFADGGIVSGTTLGVMGEYTGAKQNPEVIAPLNKLEGMLGAKQPQQVNVGGEFRIQGQDLVVALQRAERNRSRLK